MAISERINEKWRVLGGVEDCTYVMVRKVKDEVYYAPLYVHSFRYTMQFYSADVIWFQKVEAKKTKLKTTGDKLRYYRHKKGLKQSEVADYIGISRSVYADYEEGKRNSYPVEVVQKLVELFGVSVELLLDEYNAFLFKGQGEQIRELREKQGLTQSEFAKIYGASLYKVRNWENGKIIMSKKTWEELLNLKSRAIN